MLQLKVLDIGIIIIVIIIIIRLLHVIISTIKRTSRALLMSKFKQRFVQVINQLFYSLLRQLETTLHVNR